MRSLRVAGTFVLLLCSAVPVHAAEGSNLPRVANFAILVAVLFFALRKPLADYLTARTEQIRQALGEAREKTTRAEREVQLADTLRAGLQDEVEKAKGEARRAVEAERARILSSAEEEAFRIREIARKEIENEVEAGRRRLLAKAAELSVSLAQKKLESTMSEEDQKRLIERSIEALGRSGP